MTKIIRQGQLGSRKSHTGCITCKIRRVKCGEERPSCLRCSSTGRKCDGYIEDRRTTSEYLFNDGHVIEISACPAAYFDIEATEMEAFEFFICRVLPGFSGAVNHGFWCQVLPQLSRVDKIIWNAVSTMAQLIRYPQFDHRWITTGIEPSTRDIDRNHQKAIVWYNASITDLRSRMKCGASGTGFLLVTCLLYTIIECLQDNHGEALKLFQQAMALAGRSVLTSSQNGLKTTSQDPLESAATALLRHMSVAQGSPLAWRKLSSHPRNLIASLEDAREEGYVLLAACHRFIVEAQEIQLTMPRRKAWLPSRDLELRRDDLLARFTQWKDELEAVVHRLPLQSPHDEELFAVLMLSFFHYYIWMSTSLSTYETSYDAYLPEFQQMLCFARRVLGISNPTTHRPVFVFEARVIPALTFLATKCRHVPTRQNALSLLQYDAPEMEYYFKARAMARIAAKVIQLEEASCVITTPQSHDTDVSALQHKMPEESRVWGYRVVLERPPQYQNAVECLRYGRWYHDAVTGIWTLREQLVEL
jgi:hypothetical protein